MARRRLGRSARQHAGGDPVPVGSVRGLRPSHEGTYRTALIKCWIVWKVWQSPDAAAVVLSGGLRHSYFCSSCAPTASMWATDKQVRNRRMSLCQTI